MQFKSLVALCLLNAIVAYAFPTTECYGDTCTNVVDVASGASSSNGNGNCDTGPIQCCNQVQSSKSNLVRNLLASQGIYLGDADIPIGIACSSIGDVVRGGKCSGQTVCCKNNHFNGVVALGCVNVVM